MTQVTLTNVSKKYGDTAVLQGVDLHIADGEFVVLVGPSGCGKTTLLRMMCGLEEISGGELAIDGHVVNHLPPAQRGIAMVFQSYALYPHMTVFDNMGFGLKLHGADRAERKRRIESAAKALHIDHLLQRLPRELSGGQRQRVAIGRAIVRDPKLFLFDEPLSNLDASLRARTRVELARLHSQLQATMVFVTHDQVEAMTLADRIAVMKGGAIEQCAPPLEVYHRPATRFVAGFVGTPAMNFLPVTAVEPGRVRLCDVELTLPVRCDAPTELGIRPEGLTVAAEGTLAGRVEVLERLGERTLVHLQSSAGCPVIAELPRGAAEPALGENVALALDIHQALLFDAAGRAYHPA